jgi:aspartokinase
MKKIADAIEEVIEGNPALAFGIHHRLMNLTQLARFLRPSVEAQTRKEVSDAAVLMSLSRLQRKWSRSRPQKTDKLLLDKVSIVSGLCSVTLAKTETTHRELNRVFAAIQEQNGFITITEGLREITVIVEEENFGRLRKALSSRPKIVHRSLASVGMTFSERYLSVKGVLHQLLEQVALQNINVLEVASTATEFYIYVEEKDVETAFGSIFRRFGRTPSGRS